MTALYLRLHSWRGFSVVNIEPDLFHHVWRCGFFSVYICRACLLDAYRKIKNTVRHAVDMAEGK